MWDLPGPGIEPMSPALAGVFLTTVPPGKSPCFKYDHELLDLSIFDGFSFTVVLIFIATQIIPPLASGGLLRLTLKCFAITLKSLIAFLLSSMRRYLRLILYISCPSPEPGISPRSSDLFYREWFFKTMIWERGMLFAAGLFSFLLWTDLGII